MSDSGRSQAVLRSSCMACGRLLKLFQSRFLPLHHVDEKNAEN